MYNHIKEIVADSEKTGKPISELIIEQECKMSGQPREKIWNRMKYNLETMREAVKKGRTGNGVYSSTGLTGGEAVKIKKYREKGHTLSGDTIMSAVQNAVATNEVNAAMGVICATPTAGSSGTLPGVLFMLEKRLNLTEEQMIRFLFTAGGFGMVIANNAEIAGATGGCQAEVGSASAMGAAAAVEVAGGTAEQSAQALSIAMSNLLGLVCDPIAGLVEVPCVKRNAIGASNALVAADMALAGCTSVIPADECIDAMKKVGHQMPASLRETGIGGLAGTPTGQAIKAKFLVKMLKVKICAIVKQSKMISLHNLLQ
ncbi:L-serine ammonia-lyase, iron-sulfur-dependent, subunit alpha [Lactobacillus acidophilus]|nr:L-serine ammonia-lyase, iron-sulfur-dependent, subunit alpha [Lactobacillus acidophilus]MUV44952.1 L-serine ammonia-lyase, iron-sulfur-dependent, subunit alpha [Lactobacillus acidophilus]